MYRFKTSEILGFPREVLDRARRSRDARFDGKFFIAVLSTGIYCRSICPVRLHSSAVRYYASAAESAAAGFRPCLRCRPEAAPGSPAWTGTSAVVRRVLRLIHDGALDKGSVEDLAVRVGVGARYLNRLLVDQIGASLLAIAQTRRLHFAKRLLDDTDLPVTEIALSAGYGSVRRFNSALKETYKRSPRELRKRRAAKTDAADEISLRLAFRPPYDWSSLLGFLSQREVAGVERVDAGGYARTVRTSTGHAWIVVNACEDADALLVRVRGAPSSDLFDLSSRIRRVFDLAADPLQICDAFGADARLGALVTARPGLRIPGVWEPFECAVRAIVGEQRTPDAARLQLSGLVERAGQAVASEWSRLSLLFPTPQALAQCELADLGMTPARAQALHEVAQAVFEGRLNFGDSVEEVTQGLARIAVLGPSGAQYVALRGLGEPDAFPSADVTLRRDLLQGASVLTPRALEASAEAWRPWRGYAAFHLWAAAAVSDGCAARRFQPVPAGVTLSSKPRPSR